MADDEVHLVEAGLQARGIGVGRQHVGAQQHESAQAALLYGLQDGRHLVGDVVARRTRFEIQDVAGAKTVGQGRVARPQAAARLA